MRKRRTRSSINRKQSQPTTFKSWLFTYLFVFHSMTLSVISDHTASDGRIISEQCIVKGLDGSSHSLILTTCYIAMLYING
jgi:hypothetical protein